MTAPTASARMRGLISRFNLILLKGLVTILPIGLTAYLIYWLGVTTENLLSQPLKWVVDDAYWPGMGLVVGFLLLFIVGLAVNAFVVRKVLSYGEDLLLRVPVVKTVYAAIRDMTRLVNTGAAKKRELERVVTVAFGPGRVIGFVTQEHASTLGVGGGDDLVAVYLPMSYQIGGYTVYLPRSELGHTDLKVEQAMRIVLTGGVQGR
jgi:uncharacterized membrane protein